ncbi:MAG: HEAT repeat domain-containing protein [Imperialibacter sp.]|uniref:HEAT repeat domain-containing protein n=1 Tax=Imperialibacter sp. TaxID=2038411 RepID=UPI0032EB12FD
MLQAFLKFLGGEPGEEKQMWLLLGKGFFMGIFLATYTVGAETLFISRMGEGLLGIAFFTGGFLGIVSTIVFVSLQRNINFSSLAITNTFLILAYVTLLRGTYEFYDSPWISFAFFVMMGPITAVTLLTFWGVFGRMFNLRASKRIMGGIDTGQLLATCLAFFSIPGLRRLQLINDTTDLLFISIAGAFGIFIFTLLIVKNYNLDGATKKVSRERPNTSYSDLFKSKYLGLLSMFLIFSASANVFVEYSFYESVNVMYPNETELSNFLSFYDGSIIVISFIIQSFLNDLIIGKFGLKVSLMVMPIVLAGLTIGAIVSGHIFGFEVKNEEYILFFLFTGLARLLTASLKDALENPAFKIFFLPLDIKIRFDIQSRVEGVVNEFAALISGAALIGLGLLSFFKLIHFSYIIIFLAVGVIYVAVKLYDEYKGTLKITLTRQKEALGSKGKKNENSTVNVLQREFDEHNAESIILSMKLFEKLEPIEFRKILVETLKSPHPEVRKYAYAKCRQVNNFEKLAEIKKLASYEQEEQIRNLAIEVIAFLQLAEDYKLNEVSIRKLVRSVDKDDRVFAAQVLAKLDEEKYIPLLVELARDINVNVRTAAIASAGINKWPELWPILIENLHVPIYSNVAKAALTAGGEATLHTVDTAFYKTGQQGSTMFRVVQILGRIGGPEGVERLWKKIDFPDKAIVSEILLSLSYIGYHAKDFQAARIKIQIEAEIGDLAWNIKVLTEIPTENETDQLLVQAMEEENAQNYDDIYMLLALIYDSQAVELVKENINVGTSESVTFAVEMLDIILEDELKPKLFPVFDELKPQDRLSQLNDFYAPETFRGYEDLLLSIVNRDYNHINRWTKAVALYRLSMMDETKVSADLIANLFNPDKLILQTSAWIIYQKDKAEYQRHTRRIRPGVKKDLDRAIVPPTFVETEEDLHMKMLLIEKAVFVKGLDLFKTIPGSVLTDVVDASEEVRMKEGITFINKGDNGNAPIYIIVKGSVLEQDDNGRQRTLGSRDVIGFNKLVETDQFEYNYTTTSEVIFLTISMEALFDLMSKNIEMVEATLLSVKDSDQIEAEDEVMDEERLLLFSQ